MSSQTAAAAPSQPQQLVVESADVIKLMLQFCKENNLHQTMRTLQEETQVTLNTVDSVDKFMADIQHGRWESVLSVTTSLTLPTGKMIDLFEQIVLELAELREFDTARALLRAAPALQTMKKEQPERYLFLEHLMSRAANHAFDAAAAYPDGSSKEKRRQAIALALQPEVQVVAPSRLMCLLTQSLKWQQLQGLLPKGARYDLFRGGAPVDAQAANGGGAGAADAFPTKNSKVIKFGSKSYPECVRFSPDGSLLVSGSCDGYIELWEPDSGRLSLDYAYQADDNLMSHDSAVLCLAFNLGVELLASGASKGDVKVWRIATGSCVRKFPSAHGEGVTSIEFVRDGTQILTASFDHTIKLHGLKSGRTLKEFRGHTSYVNAATFSPDQSLVVSASSDGTVRVWDAKTCDCVRTVRLQSAGNPLSLLSLQWVPGSADRVALVERSGVLRVINIEGAIIHTFHSTSSGAGAAPSSVSGALPPDGAASARPASASASARSKKGAAGGSGGDSAAASSSLGDFVAAVLSPKGAFLYGVTEECVLHCFDMNTTKLVHAIKLHRSDVLGIAHHPHRNLLASFAQEGTIKLWKP